MDTKVSRCCLILAATFFAAGQVKSQVYTEIGDAGQTPGTAQSSGLTQSATVGSTVTILGNISGVNDADVFSLTLSAPSQVQFSTVNNVTKNSGQFGGLDTELFLFTSTGKPVYANDDASGTTVSSKLPSGTSLTLSLSSGTYFIGLSLSGNEPVNTANQLVFAANSDPTAVRGPAPGLNPNAWSGFNNGASPDNGNYEIDITTVPEPSVIALVALGAIAFVVLALRRRRAVVPETV